MPPTNIKRLTQELTRLRSHPLPQFLTTLQPTDDSTLTTWHATILGPAETPYSAGRWSLAIEIPDAYPLKPPSVRFTTKILHANINPDTGEICLDLLKDKWSPANTLLSVCEAIEWLLRYPEPDSPLNVDLAVLYRGGDLLAVEAVIRWAVGEWIAPLDGDTMDPRDGMGPKTLD